MLLLSSTRELAVSNIRAAQKKFKHQYDKKSWPVPIKLWDWVLIHFPQEESGKQRKLSRLWHGLYHIIAKNDPDVTMIKSLFSRRRANPSSPVQSVELPTSLPAGLFWVIGKVQEKYHNGFRLNYSATSGTSTTLIKKFGTSPSEECTERSSISGPDLESVEPEPDQGWNT